MIGTIISLAIRIGGIGIYFFAMVVLARAVSPREFGLYSFAVEIAALFCAIASLGLNMIAIRVVPDFLSDGDSIGLRRFIDWGILTTVIGSISLGGLFFSAWLGGWLASDYPAVAVMGVCLVLITLALLRFFQELMRAAGRMVSAQAAEQIVWPLVLLGLGLFLFFMKSRHDLIILLTSHAAVYFVSALGLLLLSRRLVAPGMTARRNPNPTMTPYREWIAIGWPLAVSTMMLIFLNRGDILALGVLAGPREVALYTPASRYAALMILGQAAASMAMAGQLRQAWKHQDRDEFQAKVDDMACVSVFFAIVPFAALMMVPGPLLSFFGPDYTGATDVLRVLAFAQLVNAWTGPIAVLTVVCELQRAYAACVGLICIGLAILLTVLIPPFGGIGAAIATLACISVLNIAMSIVIWRHAETRCWATLPCLLGFLRYRISEMLKILRRRSA